MGRFRIGVICDSFRLPLLESIHKAKEFGADGIQVYAVSGEMTPESMDPGARKAFRRTCGDLGLGIAALCGDLGGHGFQRKDENTVKVPRSKAIVDLAADLGCDVVTTHIGVVPEDEASPTYETMLTACREIGDYAAEKGVRFAVETGPEPAERLRRFLENVDSKGMRVNLDPANLLMVLNEDPVDAVHTLGDYIVHTHAKDGVHHRDCDPAAVYEAFATGGVEAFPFGEYFSELPLGEGRVEWDRYLDALAEIRYSGFLTIEREVGENPHEDIAQAVRFLRKKNQ